jgi:hypothetical protein
VVKASFNTNLPRFLHFIKYLASLAYLMDSVLNVGVANRIYPSLFFGGKIRGPGGGRNRRPYLFQQVTQVSHLYPLNRPLHGTAPFVTQHKNQFRPDYLASKFHTAQDIF